MLREVLIRLASNGLVVLLAGDDGFELEQVIELDSAALSAWPEKVFAPKILDAAGRFQRAAHLHRRRQARALRSAEIVAFPGSSTGSSAVGRDQDG